jgi:hypothetical protein
LENISDLWKKRQIGGSRFLTAGPETLKMVDGRMVEALTIGPQPLNLLAVRLVVAGGKAISPRSMSRISGVTRTIA